MTRPTPPPTPTATPNPIPPSDPIRTPTPTPTPTRPRTTPRPSSLRTMLTDASLGPPIFWTWNFVFLGFVFLGFAPVALADILRAFQTGDIAPAFALWGVALVLIPALSVVFAQFRLRDRPEAMYALFYGVEAPLMLIAAVRLFVLRDLPAHATMLYAASLLGIAALAVELWFGRREITSRFLLGVRLAGLTVLAVTGAYVAVWVAFLAVPMAWVYVDFAGELLGEVGSAIRRLSFGSLAALPFGEMMAAVLGVPLFLFTGSLFIASPILVPTLYARRWARAARDLTARSGPAAAGAVAFAVVVAWVVAYEVSARQPQHAAFAALERFTALDDGLEGEAPGADSERAALARRESRLKAGLLNAYLARYRYAGTSGVYRQIENMYASSFGWERDLEPILAKYDRIARPILYEPVNPVTGAARAAEDPARAAQLYAAFFDAPIVEAELPAVRRALVSTWRTDVAAAGLADIEDRDVRLERQSISVAAEGPVAAIEIHETYRNQTFTEQEVFYYLTLPESAAVTGLWLGTSPDKTEADVFRVSTRGAAQALYLEERRIVRDPALMEQIGPRQYRLRIFPIPARRTTFDESGARDMTASEGDALHLWLEVHVLKAGGVYPMPVMTERRNVYWDGRTERTLDGLDAGALPAADAWSDDAWLPSAVPAAESGDELILRADFEGGRSVVARAADTADTADAADPVEPVEPTDPVVPIEPVVPVDPADPPGAAGAEVPPEARVALVVDRSRSMADVENGVRQALAEVRAFANDGDADRPLPVDVFLTASPVRGEPASLVPLEALSDADLTFFGGMTPAELIAQFAALRPMEVDVRPLDDGEAVPEIEGAVADVGAPSEADAPLDPAVPAGVERARSYASVLVLTDAGGFSPAADVKSVFDLGAPLWFVHVGGQFPPGYPDALLEAMRASGGGSTGSVREALQRSLGSEGDLVDGYEWHVVPTEVAELAAPNAIRLPAFEPLAARRLILEAEREARADLAGDEATARLAGLDGLHALAVEHGIVTPYSSMIVLVNTDQHRRLDALEAGDDRFAREVEDQGPERRDLALAPVTAVPEPEEWLLIALAAAAVAVLARRRLAQEAGARRVQGHV